MKVLISGGTGLIGQALSKLLLAKGNDVCVLSRSKSREGLPRQVELAIWDAKTLGSWTEKVEESDAIVNLAGASIGTERWTKERKNTILQSRLNVGQILAEAVRNAAKRPHVLVQSSGVGIYGTDEEEVFDDYSNLGSGFMPETAKQWEDSTSDVEQYGVRRIIIRTGVVLDRDEGALPRMMLPFQLFVGGPLGNGRQWVSWIHLADEVRAIEFLLANNQAQGVYNLTAPNPVRNAEFGKTLGKVLKRPYWIPVPGFALRLVLGDMSSLVLEGQNVQPRRLQDAGFEFQYANLSQALRNII